MQRCLAALTPICNVASWLSNVAETFSIPSCNSTATQDQSENNVAAESTQRCCDVFCVEIPLSVNVSATLNCHITPICNVASRLSNVAETLSIPSCNATATQDQPENNVAAESTQRCCDVFCVEIPLSINVAATLNFRMTPICNVASRLCTSNLLAGYNINAKGPIIQSN